MERIALQAEYRTENIFNEGYICISKDGKGEVIEGVFGNDYLKLDFVDDSTLHMDLFEVIPVNIGHLLIGVFLITSYESNNINDHQIYCPDEYFFENGVQSLSLNILKVEKNPEKKKKIFDFLNEIRPQPFKKQL